MMIWTGFQFALGVALAAAALWLLVFVVGFVFGYIQAVYIQVRHHRIWGWYDNLYPVLWPTQWIVKRRTRPQP